MCVELCYINIRFIIIIIIIIIKVLLGPEYITGSLCEVGDKTSHVFHAHFDKHSLSSDNKLV